MLWEVASKSTHFLSPVFLMILLSLTECSSDQPSVTTPAGVIQGIQQTAPDGRQYHAFFGIPFAKPPVGELRFAKPQMHPPFVSPFNASTFGKFCLTPQQGIAVYVSGNSEDCLFLNIFKSSIPPVESQLKKVMVFIHGGGFHFGTSSLTTPGSFVVEHDVIVVTIQYRLGILGFFSLENDASPGNYGLWDQILAIQWVKVNIRAFGGDDCDITIAGVSAGGASVGHLSVTPTGSGLFTKAIAMSGTSTTGLSLSVDPKTHALDLAKTLKCWEGDINDEINVHVGKEIITCLRTRSVQDIATNASFWVVNPRFLPSVDGDFIPENPLKLVNSTQHLASVGFFDRRYLVTLNNNEKSVDDSFFERIRRTNTETSTSAESLHTSFEPLCEAVEFFIRFRFDLDKPPARSVIEKVAKWYENDHGTDGIVQLFTDLGFPVPSLDFANAATLGDTSLWLLLHDHYPSYLEGRSRDPSVALTSQRALVRGWPKYDAQDQAYLSFSLTPEVKQRLEEDKRRLWWEIIPTWLKHSPDHSEL